MELVMIYLFIGMLVASLVVVGALVESKAGRPPKGDDWWLAVPLTVLLWPVILWLSISA